MPHIATGKLGALATGLAGAVNHQIIYVHPHMHIGCKKANAPVIGHKMIQISLYNHLVIHGLNGISQIHWDIFVALFPDPALVVLDDVPLPIGLLTIIKRRIKNSQNRQRYRHKG